MAMTMLTALQTLKEGDRIRFTDDYSVIKVVDVGAGETGTVVENALGEDDPILFVKLDEVKPGLKRWGNVLQLHGPGVRYDPDRISSEKTWQREVPFEVIP